MRNLYRNALIALPIIAALIPSSSFAQYETRTEWNKPSGGTLNISVFTFRDANRDGTYDMGDRPMSGVVVDATGFDRTETAVSNSAGFANFRMSGTSTDAEITFAGPYKFHTLVPPGWSVTTGNDLQQSVFELMPGSPADLVAKPAPSLVGLMPDLSISGRVADKATTVEAVSPTGEIVPVSLRDDDSFVVPASPGDWQLRWHPKGAADAVTTKVTVDQVPVVVASLDQPAAAPDGVAQPPITFDELVVEGILKIPSGYDGLKWNNFVAAHQKFYDPEGYRNTAMSGEFVAYNGSGHPATLSADKPFTFVGGYFGASTGEAEGLKLTVKAWRGDNLAYSEDMTLSSMGARYFLANFTDVTRVEFTTDHYWQVACDNLDVRL